LARINFFGNTNNYPYLLVKGLRSLGHDARLVVNQSEALHRPEAADASLARGYPDWIYDCSSLSEEEFVAEAPRICDVLNFIAAGDCAVLNHLGPSLASRLTIPHVAFLTGSDITYYANLDTLAARSSVWDEHFRRSPGGLLAHEKWHKFIGRQRIGIATARGISCSPKGWIPEVDRILEEIGVQDDRRFSMFICETSELQYSTPPSRAWLRVLNGARINWKKPMPAGFTTQDDKGTDVLLEGFAAFLRHGGKAELRIFRKGLHVKETEQLACFLGIESQITWLDEMPLSAFREEMRQADIVCDQLGPSFPGMTALDAMALGRPVIGNFKTDWFERQFGEALPVCQAATAQEITRHLDAFAGTRERIRKAGLAAREFAVKHLSPEANAARCLQRLGL
jgi:glycosyltransferase involved in cell wall biosynthesis